MFFPTQQQVIDVASYLESRGKFAIPDAKDAFVFLVTEAGEVGDVVMRNDIKYIRNTKTPTDYEYRARLGEELSDVIFMAILCAHAEGVNLAAAFRNKVIARVRKHLGEDAVPVAEQLLSMSELQLDRDREAVSYWLTQPELLNAEGALKELKPILERYLKARVEYDYDEDEG